MENIVYVLLLVTSIIGLTFIVERGLALRTQKVIPAEIEAALETCRTEADVPMLHRSFDPSGKTPVGLYDPKIAEPAPQPARGLFFCLCLALLQNKPVTAAALALLDTYRAFVAAGVPELQARGCAADAWDAAAAAYPLEDPNGWHTIISRL